MDLVKAVDAAVKAAAENEPSRAVDSLQFLTKQDVTASLLLSTGAGKKVRCIVDANGIHRQCVLGGICRLSTSYLKSHTTAWLAAITAQQPE